jgi:hypothetical protein
MHKRLIYFIGLHLNVKDEKWATAIEECISGRNLRSFVVDNEKNDGPLFRQIAAQCRW